MGLGKVLSKSLESSPLMTDVISKEKKTAQRRQHVANRGDYFFTPPVCHGQHLFHGAGLAMNLT